ncbi:hypothetical protein P0082_05200 [Candidatus Haliotispira prima]|uniref:Uncharacterized protein n=1 Tax=Candidatus Haliotispira prima TaxID=3034016 RepID=A0ABY8MJQ3_9SPIO|nr:hypothetical protein P0082_05200 [Candidatus Haliotispira prima]
MGRDRKKYSGHVLRHLTVALLAGEGRQYAAFLLFWYLVRAGQSVLRSLNLFFGLLFVTADIQELAEPNFVLVLELGFYSALLYAVVSVLLFLLAPGSQIMQGAQEYLVARRDLASQMRAAASQAAWKEPWKETSKENRENRESSAENVNRDGSGDEDEASPVGREDQSGPRSFRNVWRLWEWKQTPSAGEKSAGVQVKREAAGARRAWNIQRYQNNLKLHYRLWLRLPMRNILYLLETVLALVWGAVMYLLAMIQGFNMLY